MRVSGRYGVFRHAEMRRHGEWQDNERALRRNFTSPEAGVGVCACAPAPALLWATWVDADGPAHRWLLHTPAMNPRTREEICDCTLQGYVFDGCHCAVLLCLARFIYRCFPQL